MLFKPKKKKEREREKKKRKSRMSIILARTDMGSYLGNKVELFLSESGLGQGQGMVSSSLNPPCIHFYL